MSEPFLGDSKVVAFSFATTGWALCNGQTLPIAQNMTLSGLLGTTYGGDGSTTFGLPDLRGRAPMHVGNSHVLGERGGELTHTLTLSELAAHTHPAFASSLDGNQQVPTNNLPAGTATAQLYTGTGTNLTALHPSSVSTSAGGSQAHENLQPYLVLAFIIALQGIVPTTT